MTTFSSYFDGNISLLRQTNLILYSFNRKLEETGSLEVGKLVNDDVLKLIDSIRLDDGEGGEEGDDEER